MPLRLLRGNRQRLALTVIALACGVALVCATDLATRSVFAAFSDTIDTMAGRAALQVRAGEGGIFEEAIASRIAQVPGVELAVPVVSATAFTADDAGELLTVHGVDIGQDAAVRLYDSRDESDLTLDDPLIFLSQPDSVALTRTFMTRRGLRIGGQIDLDTPTGRQRFTIRGSLEPRGVARVYGGNLVVMDIFAAQRHFARPEFINRVDVAVRRGHDLTAVGSAIAATLPSGLRVEPPAQRKADLNKGMQAFGLILRGVGMLCLGAAMLIAFNRVSAVFEANVWQLGVLQAVGVQPVAVWWELVKQALLLGLAGTVLGIPVGIGLGHLALPILAQAMALAYNLTPPDAGLGVSATSIALAAATGIGAAMLAAIAPAWRATKLGIQETLRGRGLEQGATIRPWTLGASVVVGAGILAGVALQRQRTEASWGLLATALIAVATVLAARPLLEHTSRPVLEALRGIVGPVTRFASDSLLGGVRRSALTVAMLAVGLATVIWLGILGGSFERSVIETVTEAFRADLVVSSAHVSSGFFEAPIDDTVVRDLNEVPGVLAAAGERLVDWSYRGRPIILNAFDDTYFLDPGFGRWRLLGTPIPEVWQRVGHGDAVIVSSNFLFHTGLRVGDTMTLETPNGTVSVVIAAATLDFASAGGTLEMSRTLYSRHWHDSQVTRVLVQIEPGMERDGVARAIARALGRKYRIRILSAADLVEYFATQVRRAFASVYVLAGMVLLVILVGMADTLAGGVGDRIRQLGILRAVGVESFHLRRLILAEALVLGAYGVALAILAGVSMGTLWVNATFPYLFGWVLHLHVPLLPMLFVTLITLTVCMAAALVPARQAARVDPVIALRAE